MNAAPIAATFNANDSSALPRSPTKPDRDPVRVLVIGAGPAGLATAACLQRLGVNADLIDRSGLAGGAFCHLDGGITLSSPAIFTQLPHLPIRSQTQYITIAAYRTYLGRYCEHFGLVPQKDQVERIERIGNQFSVKLSSKSQPRIYDAVVAATGMCDYPVAPSVEGLTDDAREKGAGPEVMHSRDWPGSQALKGRRILIIGGASSAVAIAEQCAADGMRVTVSTRQKRVRFSFARVFGYDLRRWTYPLARRLPRWLFGKRCSLRPAYKGTEKGFVEYRRAGLIDVRGAVKRFNGNAAEFAEGPGDRFDVVVLATGYKFSMPFLPAEVARAPAGQPLADRGESRSWPGLFFVGIPCARAVSSEFLHGMAEDAPRVAELVRQRLAQSALRDRAWAGSR